MPQEPLDSLVGKRVARLALQARASRQRRTIALAGEAGWCRGTAQGLLGVLPETAGLWVGANGVEGMTTLDNSAAQRYLGCETGLLVYDAFLGLDVNAFGALCGSLRGGGLLILLVPPLAEWPRYADPQHARINVAGYPPGAVGGRFLTRLGRLLRDPRVFLVEQGGPLPEIPTAPAPPVTPGFHHPSCRTADQLAAVEAIHRCLTGHRHRPLVLISDRGRGKSSALGIAAAGLLREGHDRLLVTAPRLAATAALFHWAAQGLAEAKVGRGTIHWRGREIRFVAPDALLHHAQAAEPLLVDEAAAIPTPLLESLLRRHPRCVFATTQHGYEGTGRGFTLRFRQVLERLTPQWRELRLDEPIRWAPGDPLEQWLFRALALDATPVQEELVQGARADECLFQTLDRERLVDREQDLNDLFGLLVLAHYRTTPFDLRHLLDGPNLSIGVLRHRGRIVATALLAQEGGFDRANARAIWSGRRRPQGHLLAQSLAAHLGLESAARQRGARIMRIAVHPALQRRGLGSRLLQALHEQARREGLDYLGTSFGATPGLLDFWRANGFQPVRIGLRRGASSASRSVILLRPLNPRGTELMEAARSRFSRQLPQLLGEPLADLEGPIATRLLTGIEAPARFDPMDWRDLLGFAFARRGYENSLGPIQALSLQALSEGLPVEPRKAGMLVMKVLQHRDWGDCARSFGLPGRAGVEGELRTTLRGLFLHYADESLQRQALSLGQGSP